MRRELGNRFSPQLFLGTAAADSTAWQVAVWQFRKKKEQYASVQSGGNSSVSDKRRSAAHEFRPRFTNGRIARRHRIRGIQRWRQWCRINWICICSARTARGWYQISFTDMNWNGNQLTGGEGSLTWTVPAGGLALGTLIQIQTSTSSTVNLGSLVQTGNAINFSTMTAFSPSPALSQSPVRSLPQSWPAMRALPAPA